MCDDGGGEGDGDWLGGWVDVRKEGRRRENTNLIDGVGCGGEGRLNYFLGRSVYMGHILTNSWKKPFLKVPPSLSVVWTLKDMKVQYLKMEGN
jgi:hypothetical protein